MFEYLFSLELNFFPFTSSRTFTQFLFTKMWRPWDEESLEVVEENNGDSLNDENPLNDENQSARKLRVHLSSDAKEIVKNVYSALKERNFTKCSAIEETSKLAKISRTAVWRIVSVPDHQRKTRIDFQKSKIDYADEDMIRRKVYEMYVDQIVPTLDSLQKRLQNDECGIDCSRTSLWRCLNRIGFKHKKIDKKNVIMESPRIRQWRSKYLTEIRKYRRENRSIIYLDETWYDTHDTVSKGWVDQSDKCRTRAPSNRGKRITILHAGSENGWVPNALLLSAKNIADSSLDYHEDTTGELFENWFQHQLLPNIPANSIIVMDNAKYHSRECNKVPSGSSSKQEIKEFLYDKDIYFEEHYTKKQLLEVLKSYNFEKTYICDNMAELKGHKVLRLPPYHCILNPIEQVWHQVKSGVRVANTSPTLNSSVIELIRVSVSNVTNEQWKKYAEHGIKVEQTYFGIENQIPEMIINLGEDSDSESDNDSIVSMDIDVN